MRHEVLVGHEVRHMKMHMSVVTVTDQVLVG